MPFNSFITKGDFRGRNSPSSAPLQPCLEHPASCVLLPTCLPATSGPLHTWFPLSSARSPSPFLQISAEKAFIQGGLCSLTIPYKSITLTRSPPLCLVLFLLLLTNTVLFICIHSVSLTRTKAPKYMNIVSLAAASSAPSG